LEQEIKLGRSRAGVVSIIIRAVFICLSRLRSDLIFDIRWNSKLVLPLRRLIFVIKHSLIVDSALLPLLLSEQFPVSLQLIDHIFNLGGVTFNS